MIHINLLPARAERRKELIRKQVAIAVLTLLFTLVAMGFLLFRAQSQYNRTQSKLTRINKKIHQLEPIIKKIDHYKKQKEEISKKIDVIIDLDRYRLVPVVILSDLNRHKPEKLWFTSLKESEHNLTISGVAIDNETIVNFLNNLKLSAPLKNADLTILRSQKIQDLQLKEFTIHCTVDLASLADLMNTQKISSVTTEPEKLTPTTVSLDGQDG
jgi:type IV pilus assembly protein PilN